MEAKEIILNGRKYLAYVSPDEQQGAYVVIGPPEGMVDDLKLPEPFATRLHNVMYERGIFKTADATKRNAILGVLQEALSIDANLIVEMFQKYERES